MSVLLRDEERVIAAANGLPDSWSQYLSTAVLVLVRLSGVFVFAPVFSSAAIAARIKAGFAIALTVLLVPAVAAVPGAVPSLSATAILGELSVGLLFGLSLMVLTECLAFAGMLLGMQFSFSLVNLLDPNTMVDTPVLGQMLNWLGILVLLQCGLDRTLLATFVRTFCTVPVGQAVMQAHAAVTLSRMIGGVFLSGLQLAAPVMTAAMTVEVTMALIGRLSPQLPAMVVSIPLKTMVSYLIFTASLGVWPLWIERHFDVFLDAAQRLVVHP